MNHGKQHGSLPLRVLAAGFPRHSSTSGQEPHRSRRSPEARRGPDPSLRAGVDARPRCPTALGRARTQEMRSEFSPAMAAERRERDGRHSSNRVARGNYSGFMPAAITARAVKGAWTGGDPAARVPGRELGLSPGTIPEEKPLPVARTRPAGRPSAGVVYSRCWMEIVMTRSRPHDDHVGRKRKGFGDPRALMRRLHRQDAGWPRRGPTEHSGPPAQRQQDHRIQPGRELQVKTPMLTRAASARRRLAACPSR